MFYIKLIFNIVLVISRFTRLLISSFLNAVSEWLILHWKNSQESHVLDNLHLRHDLDEINDAENEEAFYPSNESSSVKVGEKEEKVVTESSLCQNNKDEYIDLVRKVKYEAAKVRRRVDDYTQNQITILDEDTHNAKLEKINEENMAFQDWIASYSSIIDDENIPPDIIMVLETISKVADELNKYVKKNATEVKRKLIELLRENDENKPIPSATRVKFDLERQKLERKRMVDVETANEKKRLAADSRNKILKRIKYVRHEAKALSLRISKHKDVENMTEHEVRKAVLESVKWQFDIQTLEDKVAKIDIDSI